jgi:hypothetical protein
LPDLKRALLLAACAFLLLAQHIGLAHAVWHALDKSPAPYQKQDSKPASSPGKLCSFDAALGQVLGGLTATPYVFSAEPPPLERTQTVVRVAPPARFLAPLSRGPPALS